MTKDQLLDRIMTIESTIDEAADNLQDVGAFLDYKDDQEEQFWSAYDVIRFQLIELRQLARRVRDEV